MRNEHGTRVTKAKRYRVAGARQYRKGRTDTPHTLLETDDVDEALDRLEHLLDHETDDVLITFQCRSLKDARLEE